MATFRLTGSFTNVMRMLPLWLALLATSAESAYLTNANALWPCSSSHRLPDSGTPIYFQLQAAAGCECVFTLEGPPGRVLRVALGAQPETRGFFFSTPVVLPTDCAHGAVRAFALQPSGELNLRATLCGPRDVVQPFETETPVAVVTTTAPWGRMTVRVDVLHPPPPNATQTTSSAAGTTQSATTLPTETSNLVLGSTEAVEAAEETFTISSIVTTGRTTSKTTDFVTSSNDNADESTHFSVNLV